MIGRALVNDEISPEDSFFFSIINENEYIHIY